MAGDMLSCDRDCLKNIEDHRDSLSRVYNFCIITIQHAILYTSITYFLSFSIFSKKNNKKIFMTEKVPSFSRKLLRRC